MKRPFLAIAALLAGSLSFAQIAEACSCASEAPEQSLVEDTQIAFVAGGTPIAMKISEDGETNIVTFQIAESLKGQSDGIVDIRTPLYGPACGASFILGSDVRVAAYMQNGKLWTGSCLQRQWSLPINSGLFETTFSDEVALPFDLCGRRIDGL